MKKRMSVMVSPPLSREDRKQLSLYIKGLKRDRPGYFGKSFSFEYRGSTVSIGAKKNPHLEKKGMKFVGFVNKNDMAGVRKKLKLFGYKIAVTADTYHKGEEAAGWVEVYAKRNVRQIVKCLKEHFKSLLAKSQPETVGRKGKWNIS